jgi:dTDP-4-dehydrorhamnose reductase
MKALPFGGAFLYYFWLMKILVTGANGFVGNYLVSQLIQNRQSIVATGKGDCRLEFDFKDNFEYVSLDFTDIEK